MKSKIKYSLFSNKVIHLKITNKMEKYNYSQAVVSDIEDYLEAKFGEIKLPEFYDFDELYGEIVNADAVTGNASGFYTFSRYQAHEFLFGNEDLLYDALHYFGYETLRISMLSDYN